ncbi:MAG: PASTA domain-containing protein [Mycobacteriales bacterium]
MSTTDEPGPLSTVGERYLLVELLGADDELELWRGHDDLAGRQVIIKRFLDPDDSWRESFRRRAAQLRAVSVPGIASVLDYDAADTTPWLVTSYADGATVGELDADGISPDDALAIIGHTALSLAALHAAGAGHGGVSAGHVIVRPDGSVTLAGPAVATNPGTAEDRAALGRLARMLLAADGSLPTGPELANLVTRFEAPDGPDLADLGRTALALASARRAETSTGSLLAASPSAMDSGGAATSANEPRRPWYDEDERKRVRNRLIALGAIVVIGGGVLLRIFSSGAGEATVPSVVGLPYVQAQHQLNEVGLRVSETFTTGPLGTLGTVIAQDPAAGTRTKVGSLVALTVAASGG